MPTGDDTYTPEIAALICKRLADGETLRAICRDLGRPAESTVRSWVLADVNDFAAQYTRAREVGYLCMADEIIDESRSCRDSVKKTVKSDGSEELVYMDAVDRSRIRVDTLKWTLSKVLPKVYGDRVAVDATVKNAKPLSDEEALAEIAELSQQLGGRYQLVEVVDEDESDTE